MDEAALPVVYTDESNNTGGNLQDADQPVFTVAGVHLDDEDANTIVESVARTMQRGAGEPKYSLLSRRPRGRATLVSALGALPDSSVKVFVADKKFMTVSKIVDLGVEPLMFNIGYNMHADESARMLAHLVAVVGPILGDSRKFDAVLDTFVLAVLQRGSTGPADYASAAEEYLASVDQSNESILRTALMPEPDWLSRLLADRASGLQQDAFDPAVPTIVAVCRAFHETLGPIHLVHDRSDVIDRNKHLILNMGHLPDPANPARSMPSAGVEGIDFGDSKAIAQLKIADWAAGAARDVAVSKVQPSRRVVSQELDDLVQSWLAAPPLIADPELLNDRLGVGNGR